VKYLIVLALAGLVFWKWQSQRNGRLKNRRPPEQVSGQPPGSTPMQACILCGLNVPQPEALQGRKGWYCCEAHRQRAEA
jgi:uncharacterized protein